MPLGNFSTPSWRSLDSQWPREIPLLDTGFLFLVYLSLWADADRIAESSEPRTC